jgi:hypothetical protein
MILKKNKNPEGVISIHLDEHKHPIAWKAKMDELMKTGMTRLEALSFINKTPFILEIYYSENNGLFLVESEAVETEIPMYNPYNGEQMEEIK